jgi:hypothetical protein
MARTKGTIKRCLLVRDLSVPGYRVVIKCDGEPDVILIDAFERPEQPIIVTAGQRP